MEAKFESTCTRCGQRIDVGDDQERSDDGWHHVTCPGQSTGEGRDAPASVDNPADGAITASPPNPRRATAKKAGVAPALPPNATSSDVRRWLREVEAKEAAEKRAPYLANVRPARSRLIEELLARYDVAPIDGDRGEKKRLAELRRKVLGDDESISQPTWFDPAKAEPVAFKAASS